MSRLIDVDELRKSIEKDTCPVNISYFYRKLRDAPTVYASPVEWHKVTARPLTDEEAEYYTEIGIEGIEYIFDCEMPEDGQEILVATKWGVDKDICCNDPDYGIELEGRGDWDGVFAWAEMPKYEEDK